MIISDMLRYLLLTRQITSKKVLWKQQKKIGKVINWFHISFDSFVPSSHVMYVSFSDKMFWFVDLSHHLTWKSLMIMMTLNHVKMIMKSIITQSF